MKTIVITLITICALIAWTNALAIEHIETGPGSEGVAINAQTQIAVVASKSYAELGKQPVDTGAIYIIDLKTRQVTNTIEVGGVPVGPAIDEETNTVVFSDKAANTVVILDLASGIEIARIPVGENPSCVGIDPEHKIAVVASVDANVVNVIDVTAAEILHTIPVEAGPVCMHDSINPNDMTAIVANTGAGMLTVMDIENGSVLETIPIGSAPVGPSLNPQTNMAIVPNSGDNTAAVVDLNTRTITHIVPVGAVPVCSVIDEETNVAFVSNYVDGSVSAINMDTGTLITTIEGVGEGTNCLDIDATQNLLMVTNHGGDVALIELDDFLGAAPIKDFTNTFFISLEPGLNMISLPLEPVVQYTARSLAKEIGATVVIRYDTALGKFVGFTPAASDDGFALNGGEGYIVNVPDGGTVAFTGAAWTNQPPVTAAPPAQTSGAWAFVVSGSVLDGDLMNASDGDYNAVVKNLRTGEIFTESLDPSGYFAAAWADLNRRAVIGAGDRVEVAVMDSSGSIVSGPFVHEVTLDAIRDAVVNVRLNLGAIIPAKSALLQNYPNPFNPQTWIPYHLRDANPVIVRIYSASGQLIRTLDLGHKDAGIYASRSEAAYWDGRNDAGEEVSSGIYFYNITADHFSATRKMIVKR